MALDPINTSSQTITKLEHPDEFGDFYYLIHYLVDEDYSPILKDPAEFEELIKEDIVEEDEGVIGNPSMDSRGGEVGASLERGEDGKYGGSTSSTGASQRIVDRLIEAQSEGPPAFRKQSTVSSTDALATKLSSARLPMPSISAFLDEETYLGAPQVPLPPLPEPTSLRRQELDEILSSATLIPLPWPHEEEIVFFVSDLGKTVVDLFATLHQILCRFEPVIHKKWKKMRKQERTKILLSAREKMPEKHRPDFYFGSLIEKLPPVKLADLDDVYSFPYINQEDLSTAKNFLLLLNSRGRNHPVIFVQKDFTNAQYGRKIGQIPSLCLNKYSIYFLTDPSSNMHYGTLKRKGVADWDPFVKHSLFLEAGDGIWVLETQQLILQFLIKICRSVLGDQILNSIMDEKIPNMPEPFFRTRHSDEWPTLSIDAVEEPYRTPKIATKWRVQTLLCAWCNAAQDHILDLRENPAYFEKTLKDRSEHMKEQVMIHGGNSRPGLGTQSYWESVIREVIVEAYRSLAYLTGIVKAVQVFYDYISEHGSKLSGLERLPLEAILLILFILRMSIAQSYENFLLLKTGFPSSPGLRSIYCRGQGYSGDHLTCVDASNEWTDLVDSFQTFQDNDRRKLRGPKASMDEFERELIIQKQLEKNHLSPWVLNVLSNIGVTVSLWHEFENFHPWSITFQEQWKINQREVQREFHYISHQTRVFAETFKAQGLAKFGTPTGDRFRYPVAERQTQPNKDTLCAAEDNLAIFWSEADRVTKELLGESLLEMHISHSKGTLYEGEIGEVKQTTTCNEFIERPVPTEAITTDNGEPNSEASLLGCNQKDSTTVSPSTAKITRSSTRKKYSVGKRAFKVFSALFYQPHESKDPPTFSWLDFLHAMDAIGYSPARQYFKLWLFTPTTGSAWEGNACYSIMFNEPHPPTPKVSYEYARIIGRRLERIIGCELEDFELA